MKMWYNVHESEEQCGKGHTRIGVVLAQKQILV